MKVYHKRRLHLERNALPVFAIPSSSNVFSEVTVLHLEENALTTFHLDSPAALANLKVSVEMVFFSDDIFGSGILGFSLVLRG